MSDLFCQTYRSIIRSAQRCPRHTSTNKLLQAATRTTATRTTKATQPNSQANQSHHLHLHRSSSTSSANNNNNNNTRHLLGTVDRACAALVNGAGAGGEPAWPDVAAKEAFATDGFVASPHHTPLLGADLIEALKDRWERLFRGDFETGLYPDEWHWREGLSLPDVTREICNGWKSDRLVAEVVTSKGVASLAQSIMGWPEELGVRVGQDDVLYKPPGGGPVGYHTDGVYIAEQFVPSHDNSVTIWIPLDDADAETGVVEYARGSHRWGQTEKGPVAQTGFHGGNEDFRSAARKVAPNGELDVVQLSVPAGCCVIHHQDVWHGSAPNSSMVRARRALGIHLIRGDLQFRAGDPFDPTVKVKGDTGPPDYIYGRYKQPGSTALHDYALPMTAGPKRCSWLGAFVSGSSA